MVAAALSKPWKQKDFLSVNISTFLDWIGRGSIHRVECAVVVMINILSFHVLQCLKVLASVLWWSAILRTGGSPDLFGRRKVTVFEADWTGLDTQGVSSSGHADKVEVEKVRVNFLQISPVEI